MILRVLTLLTVSAVAGGLPPAASLQAQTNGDKVLDLTFDDIQFEMDKEAEFNWDYVTDDIRELSGKRITLRGFILPYGTKQEGNTKFILVRDNQECCFGPGAALYDCVLVRMAKGHSVDYTVRPITVEGTFRIKEMKINGRIMAIYWLRSSKLVE